MGRIGFVCAAVTMGLLASRLPAQQTLPGQPASAEQASQPGLPPAPSPDMQAAPGVPPAPPPDVQIRPGGLPPFPPMSKRPPQHRWVDMGDHHRTKRAHRATRTQHKAKSTQRRAASHRLTRTQKDLRYCHALSHRRMMHNRRCVTLVRHEKAKKPHQLTRTEKNIRYCDGLSHKKMMRNRTCVALMKKHKATKHRAAAVRRHKATHRRR